ncbi:Uma2 family endonuclease [Synechocystis sp. PCC 7509]|uniref:Uma2 family endonuclease n=1 Tax=Synechocystis sp. PCC 7509 TaxID=927677 RepID=UPI0002AC9453|nr:Uma2 family endonuclease [Synechocystis sp. PCC 7509]
MTPSKIQTATQILPLENGDRLSRIEFERRYTTMPKLKKAELIEGIAYMGSPVRVRSHGEPHAVIMALLSVYWIATPGVSLLDNATVRLDLDNEPQPDALLRIKSGGQSIVSDDDYLEGAPELVVEIAASSAAYDLYAKKQVYRRNGVQEYIVWQVFDRKLDWFSLTEGEYVLLQPDDNGVVRSLVFPGLWLAVPLLLAGEMLNAIAILQLGLNSPEHAQFIELLANQLS